MCMVVATAAAAGGGDTFQRWIVIVCIQCRPNDMLSPGQANPGNELVKTLINLQCGVALLGRWQSCQLDFAKFQSTEMSRSLKT